MQQFFKNVVGMKEYNEFRDFWLGVIIGGFISGFFWFSLFLTIWR